MIKKIIYKIIRRFSYGRLILAHMHLINNYLKKIGWTKSIIKKLPVDQYGNPIPWLTYSCIGFLEKRVSKKLNVFEYGSGNSSLWFSNKVANVISIEHDDLWYNTMKNKLKNNKIEYKLLSLETGLYQKEILNYKNEFDIIIIDGRKRVECGLNSLEALTEQGVIIFDNSDREDYKEAFDVFKTKGFKRIDFEGIAPGLVGGSVTSVFYRENNCFQI